MGTNVRHGAYMLVSVAVFVLIVSPTQAGVEGDSELLRLVALGYKANLESVSTWRGRATVTSSTEGGVLNGSESQSSVTFAFDRDRGATRWNWQDDKIHGVIDGVESFGEGVTHRNSLIKDDAFHVFGPYSPNFMKRPYELRITHAESINLQIYAYDFDPIQHLKDRGLNTEVELLWLYQERNNPELSASVRREGDIVILVRDTVGVTSTAKYDITKGYNLTSYRSESRGQDGVSIVEWEREFEEKNGAFVPVRVRRTQTVTLDDTGETTVTIWETILKNDVVNEPLDSEEFSLAALGVQVGDNILDQRTGARYKYGDPASLQVPEGDSEINALADSVLESIDTDVEEEPAVVTPQDPPPAPIVIVEEPAADEAPTGVSKGLIAAVVAGLLALATVLVITRRKTSS